MIKKMAWNTFKNTGSIDAFMEFKKLEELEVDIKAEQYGNNKNEGNNNFRV